jgi:LPPG:FO 2-phospho-L-lactate transferase
LLSNGQTLSEATARIAEKLGIRSRILPMSDVRVETRIDTPAGELTFEEYFVKRWYQDPVKSVRFAGVSDAEPAPGVLDAISSAQAVLIAPSNPVTSIGPILAVPGIREALHATAAQVVAVSPVICGAAVSGPAANLMTAQGLQVSIAGIADAYRDFLDILIADDSDSESAQSLESDHLQLHCTNILMRTSEDKTRIARTALMTACPAIVTESAGEPQ